MKNLVKLVSVLVMSTLISCGSNAPVSSMLNECLDGNTESCKELKTPQQENVEWSDMGMLERMEGIEEGQQVFTHWADRPFIATDIVGFFVSEFDSNSGAPLRIEVELNEDGTLSFTRFTDGKLQWSRNGMWILSYDESNGIKEATLVLGGNTNDNSIIKRIILD